jgi:hypothetical protein
VFLCVFSHMYPACNAHAPYYRLWPARLFSIFRHYFRNHFQKRKFIKRKISVYIFCTLFRSSCKVTLILMIEVPDHVYFLGDTYTRLTYFFTRIGCTLLKCDMYMCRLRHIHDPVLLSLKMEIILFLYLTASMPVSAILVTRRV